MMGIFYDMWDDGWLGRSLLFTVIIMFLMIPLMMFAMVQENNHWQAFAVQHHCRVVGEMSGSTAIGSTISADGKVGIATVTSSSKTGYQCDDGITYWR